MYTLFTSELDAAAHAVAATHRHHGLSYGVYRLEDPATGRCDYAVFLLGTDLPEVTEGELMGQTLAVDALAYSTGQRSAYHPIPEVSHD